MSSIPNPLRRLLSGATALAQIRAEQASLELAQARAQLARWAVLGAAALLLALLALATATVWLALVFWERFGPATLLVLAPTYGAAAAWLLWRVRRELRAAPPLLAQTLEELARDREALVAARRDQPPPGA
jgi:uncharacterized membrane protein YqjE